MKKLSKRFSGRRAREKGLKYERDRLNAFREFWPGARRQLEFQKQDAKGVDGADTGRFRFQFKRWEKYAPIECIEEIQCDRECGEMPVLVTRGDGKEDMAVMPLSDFIFLLRRSGVR